VCEIKYNHSNEVREFTYSYEILDDQHLRITIPVTDEFFENYPLYTNEIEVILPNTE
jgi:hypothetical protein